jgi:hypothetical protein
MLAAQITVALPRKGRARAAFPHRRHLIQLVGALQRRPGRPQPSPSAVRSSKPR